MDTRTLLVVGIEHLSSDEGGKIVVKQVGETCWSLLHAHYRAHRSEDHVKHLVARWLMRTFPGIKIRTTQIIFANKDSHEVLSNPDSYTPLVTLVKAETRGRFELNRKRLQSYMAEAHPEVLSIDELTRDLLPFLNGAS
jgi:hypothetical protein